VNPVYMPKATSTDTQFICHKFIACFLFEIDIQILFGAAKQQKCFTNRQERSICPVQLIVYYFFMFFLTVHLSITLVNDQLDAQFLYFI